MSADLENPSDRNSEARFVLDDSRFMFAFAHDLRSHLRTVLTRIQLVQAGGGTTLPQADQGFLSEAAAAASNINGLLSSMVTFCDVTAKKDSLALGTLLRGVVLENQPALKAADAEIVIENEAIHIQPNVSAPRAIQIVLKELISNAIRFRRPDVPLRISVSAKLPDSEKLVVEVADNGQGVHPNETERIFAPFQRLLSRSEYPGHGMGLAIARKIVSAYNGSITAESTAGGGLTVRILLPASEANS